MFISDKIIYFELQKTGSTHTRNILKKIPSLDYKVIGKHNSYTTVSKRKIGDFNSKIKIGNIRNPWDWYVSLWTFGCMQKGDFYNQTANKFNVKSLREFARIFKSPKALFQDNSIWKELYSNSKNEKNFQQWLKIILEDKEIDLGEKYKSFELSNFAGLLTFRYLNLYTYAAKKLVPKIKNFESLLVHDKQYNFIDVMIKNESIHKMLIENTEKMGINKDELITVLKGFKERTNKSIRQKYQEYYNDETKLLVQQKEKLIIDKYNYTF